VTYESRLDEGFVRILWETLSTLHKLWFQFQRLDSDPPHSESYLKVFEEMTVSATRFNELRDQAIAHLRAYRSGAPAKAQRQRRAPLRFRQCGWMYSM